MGTSVEWQPMSTEPCDGRFRLYGLHVALRSGFRWFEVHYVARDEEGQLLHPSGDSFSDWQFSDFEVWADAPQPPVQDDLGSVSIVLGAA